MEIKFWFADDPEKKIHTMKNVKKLDVTKKKNMAKNMEEVVALFKEINKRPNHSAKINEEVLNESDK